MYTKCLSWRFFIIVCYDLKTVFFKKRNTLDKYPLLKLIFLHKIGRRLLEDVR